MHLNLVVCFSVSLLTCGIEGQGAEGGGPSSFYHLWSSRFDTIQFEMNILRENSLQSDREIGGLVSEMEHLKAACSPKSEVIDKSMPQPPELPKYEGAIEAGVISSLKQSFKDEKRHTRVTDQRIIKMVQETKDDVEQVILHVNKTESKVTANRAEMLKKMSSIERQEKSREDTYHTKMSSVEVALNDVKSEQTKLRQTVEDQRKWLVILEDTVTNLQQKQTILLSTVAEHRSLLDMLENRGCQYGSFGDHTYPGISFPKVYQVNFNPHFERKPAFMYSLRLLDSSSPLRVNAQSLELNTRFAKVRIQSWSDTKLYGARVQWMACP